MPENINDNNFFPQIHKSHFLKPKNSPKFLFVPTKLRLEKTEKIKWKIKSLKI